MKVRNGFVSNSSSSSFVIALPRDYKFSDEEMTKIRDYIEVYDDYFEYYEDKAEEVGDTELLDEREKIQMMLDGKFTEEADKTEPVTDEIKNADILKGLEYLTTTSSFWMDEPNWDTESPVHYAALSIFEVLGDKINIGSIEGGPDNGCQILNILSTSYENKEALKIAKESFANEN